MPRLHPGLQPDNFATDRRAYGVVGDYAPESTAVDSISVVHNGDPNITSYAWTPGVGFGARYAKPTTTRQHGRGVAFAANAEVAVAHIPTQNAYAWPWTHSSGYTNPGYNAGDSSDRGTDCACCGNSSFGYSTEDSGMRIFPWTRYTGIGVRYADPATMPTGASWAIAFCFNSDVAIAHSTSPFVSAYPWTPGTGFGVKYANPATLPGGNGRGVAFCGGRDIAVGHVTSPFVSTYPWTPGTGFGVKYANPATLPGGDSGKITFCGNTDLAVAHVDSPYITAYPWTPSTGFGVKYANPAHLPAGDGQDVAFCGNTDIAVAHFNVPGITAYPWTPSTGFGVKYIDPAPLPDFEGRGVAFKRGEYWLS